MIIHGQYSFFKFSCLFVMSIPSNVHVTLGFLENDELQLLLAIINIILSFWAYVVQSSFELSTYIVALMFNSLFIFHSFIPSFIWRLFFFLNFAFRVKAAGIRCPMPFLLRLHVLVMEFIGMNVFILKNCVLRYRWVPWMMVVYWSCL